MEEQPEVRGRNQHRKASANQRSWDVCDMCDMYVLGKDGHVIGPWSVIKGTK